MREKSVGDDCCVVIVVVMWLVVWCGQGGGGAGGVSAERAQAGRQAGGARACAACSKLHAREGQRHEARGAPDARLRRARTMRPGPHAPASFRPRDVMAGEPMRTPPGVSADTSPTTAGGGAVGGS